MRPCVATLLVLALGAGAPSMAQAQLQVRQQAIVGGYATNNDAVSATALIGDCDATLVGADLLLTAAHCIGASTPTEAWFGASLEGAFLGVSIERCKKHPDYPSKPGSDIAYCKLADRVTEIVPAGLASACGTDPAQQQGAWLVLRGHGYVTAAQQEVRIEREVVVRIQAVQADGLELVVGDRTHGACHGDSGGSAFAVADNGSLVLVGVISRRGPALDGNVEADCASTTIVTRIAPHLAWLAAETGAFSSASCAALPSGRMESTLPGFVPDADGPFAAAETPQRPPPAPAAATASPVVTCAVRHATPGAAFHEVWPWAALLTLALRRARRRRVRAEPHASMPRSR